MIDSRTLLAEMRARRMSRNAIVDELMEVGLTLDEATDVFDDDVPVRLRADGRPDPPARSRTDPRAPDRHRRLVADPCRRLVMVLTSW